MTGNTAEVLGGLRREGLILRFSFFFFFFFKLKAQFGTLSNPVKEFYVTGTDIFFE